MVTPSLVSFIKNLEKEGNILDGKNFEQLKSVVVSLAQEGVNARMQLCHYLTWQMNNNAQTPYKCELINDLMLALKVDIAAWPTNEPNLAAKSVETLIIAGEMSEAKIG